MHIELRDCSGDVWPVDLGDRPDFIRKIETVYDVAGEHRRSNGTSVVARIDVHHRNELWSVDDNLSQFCDWMLETGRAEPDELVSFQRNPGANPDWLYLAAVQLCALLQAAGNK